MTNYYIAIVILSVMMLAVLSLLIAENRSLPRSAQRGFHTVAGLIALAACAEFLGVLLDGADRSTRIVHITAKFLELSIAPAIPVICGLTAFPVKHRRMPFALLAFHCVLELLSAFYGFIYFVDAENRYHHCAFYGLYYLAYAIGTVYLTVQISRLSSLYQNQRTACLAAMMAFVFSGIVCQAFDASLRIVWLTVAIGFALFYIYYNELILQLDVLTGFLSRSAYHYKMEGLKKDATILFFDIDHFKQVNDDYGHGIGDECLRVISAEIRHTFGKIGLCYRYGGDEFCVVTNGIVHPIEGYISEYFRNIDDIRNNTNKKIPHVSIGYADYHCGDSVAAVVERADQMMYEYKHVHHLEQ